MSRHSLAPYDGRAERKRTKRAARRGEHNDKYAPQRTETEDREMSERLDALLAKFNEETEADHA